MSIASRILDRKGNLVEKLPYHSLHNGIMFLRDGTYEVGVEVTVPNTLFDDSLEPILLAFRHLMHSGLPTNTRLRITSEVLPARGDMVSSYINETTATEPQLLKLIKERAAALEHDFDVGNIRSWRTFVSVRMGRPIRNFRGFPSSKQKSLCEAAYRVRDDLGAGLERAGYKPSIMNSQAVFELCFRYYNPDYCQAKVGKVAPQSQVFTKKAVEKLKISPTSLRTQIAKSDVNNRALSSIVLGGHFVRGFVLSTLPTKRTYAGMMGAAEVAGQHFFLTVDVHLEEHEKAMNRVSARARKYDSAQYMEDYYSDPESRLLAAETDDALEHIYATGDRFFKISVALVLYDENKQALKRRCDEVFGSLSQIPGSPFKPFGHGMFTPFTNFAPFSGKSSIYQISLTSSNATHFFPVSGMYKGSERQIAVFRNRYFGLTTVDPFDRNADAYNGLVVGQTGSGKTFFTQYFASEFMRDANNQTIIIDRGSGYTPLVGALEGAVIKMDTGGSTSINPFDLAPGQSEPTGEDITFIQNVILAMLEGDTGQLDIGQAKPIIESAIRQVYSFAFSVEQGRPTFKTPLLSTFVKKLTRLDEVGQHQASQDQKVIGKQIAAILSRWTGEGTLGSFVDRQTNIPVSSARCVYYDTEGFRDSPDLARVGILLISQLVWRRVKRNTGQKTLVVLDEGWAILRGSEVGQAFVAEMYRRLRTTGSGVTLISQSLKDVIDNPGIMNNTTMFFGLKATVAERKCWQEAFQFPDEVVRLCGGISNIKGEYSEALVMLKRSDKWEGNLIAVHPTELDYNTFTTDADDKARLELEQKNGDPTVALNRELVS